MNADILKELRPKEALIVIKAVGLRKKYEDVLIMRYVEELSCQEIADERLHMEVESVRNLVYKSRKQFEKYV